MMTFGGRRSKMSLSATYDTVSADERDSLFSLCDKMGITSVSDVITPGDFLILFPSGMIDDVCFALANREGTRPLISVDTNDEEKVALFHGLGVTNRKTKERTYPPEMTLDTLWMRAGILAQSDQSKAIAYEEGQFKHDLLECLNLTGHPKAELLWEMAYVEKDLLRIHEVVRFAFRLSRLMDVEPKRSLMSIEIEVTVLPGSNHSLIGRVFQDVIEDQLGGIWSGMGCTSENTLLASAKVSAGTQMSDLHRLLYDGLMLPDGERLEILPRWSNGSPAF